MESKVRIKICGITNLEDALLAIELGASALGFIFYPRSPRYIEPEAARKIISHLPPFVTTVGVFVNESEDFIRKVLSEVGLDLVQLHGDESPDLCARFFPKAIKALRVRSLEDLKAISAYKGKIRAVLLDTYVKGIPGGTGQTFNWDLARKAKKFGIPVILAGGLRPENIKEALQTARPFAVDISSGVEASPGKKDPEKLQALFAAI
ncbi:MAG TPA: phosphoribosylanthranilate isomerase [Thermodesulfobacteriaceae bacterium]|nr:phosphoribosylanthranilate isomerase [Thermodesulfobacteriaceae bacterium]